MKTYETPSTKTYSLYHQTDTNFHFEQHMHTNIELVHCYDGEFVVDCGKEKYFLQAGENMLLLPGQLHSFCTPHNAKTYLCIFSGDFVAAWFGQIQNSKSGLQLCIPVFGNIRDDEIEEFQKTNCRYLQKSFLYKVCSYASKGGFESIEIHTDVNLDLQIIDYVNENYDKKISVPTLSNHFYTTQKCISNCFHKHFACSFNDYLNNIRLVRSLKDLKETNKTITDISIDCGFSSTRTFNRIFLAAYQTTPTEYRHNLS